MMDKQEIEKRVAELTPQEVHELLFANVSGFPELRRGQARLAMIQEEAPEEVSDYDTGDDWLEWITTINYVVSTLESRHAHLLALGYRLEQALKDHAAEIAEIEKRLAETTPSMWRYEEPSGDVWAYEDTTPARIIDFVLFSADGEFLVAAHNTDIPLLLSIVKGEGE
jgi:hypothetical protein